MSKNELEVTGSAFPVEKTRELTGHNPEESAS
jgi:hypothetical protein